MLKEDIEKLKENNSNVEDLKMIIDETNRCKAIVSNLLNFARQGKLELRNVNIIKLLNDLIKSIKLNPSFGNIDLFFNSNLIEENYNFDSDQIRQVLVNLITNACESLEESEKKEVHVNLTTINNDLIIEIKDTGCGIPESNINKLFEPFFTTKKIGKGTGLGLAISYGIIKMHKGNITVKSKVGEGSVFILTLPINKGMKRDFIKENKGCN